MNYFQFSIGFLIFVLGQITAWFQLNGQFIWDSWRGKPVIAMAIAPITGYLFWHAWRITSTCTESVWSARFVGFGASYMVFPLLTYFLLGESMFEPKTLICIALSVLILLVQLYF